MGSTILHDIQHKKKNITLPAVVLDFLLGWCNFGYMIVMMKNLKDVGSAAVFSILNTAIVVGTVLIGVIFYKEKRSVNNGLEWQLLLLPCFW